ncbi:MAG: PspC domain-containing protein [Propionibacteriaceae bacterium]|nr:PspC domain-containing protein [Propionibacteriaceae bacterium]
MSNQTQLRRNRGNRRIAGIAAGLSDFLGVDVTLIRALIIFGTLFTSGAMAVLYLVMWVVMPAGPTPSPYDTVGSPYTANQARPNHSPSTNAKLGANWHQTIKRVPRWVFWVAGFLVAMQLIDGLDMVHIGDSAWPISFNLIWLPILIIIGLVLRKRWRKRPSWRAQQEFEKARLAWQRRIDQQRYTAGQAPWTPSGTDFQIGSFYSTDPNVNPSTNPQTGQGYPGYFPPANPWSNPYPPVPPIDPNKQS